MRADSPGAGLTGLRSTFAFPARQRRVPPRSGDLGANYQELTTAIDRWWEALA